MNSKKRVYTCTDEEIEIIRRGMEDPDIFTNYFFRPEGEEKGWIMDDGFTDKGKWQKAVHHASQPRIMVIGGFGSGKTKGIAVSACTWAATTRNFLFLNAAPRAWQSELMYQFVLDLAENTPFDNLIWEKTKKPYPKITLKFYAKNILITSSLEFMSVDKNASGILSWEGDWINVDEAGLLDNMDEIIRNLGSRLRGTIKGRERLGRMSFISNSWDNPEMWIVFDMAKELPEDYLSINVDSRENKNITPKQIKMMLRDVPEDEHEQFISGLKPQGRGNYFSSQTIGKCSSKVYDDIIKQNLAIANSGFFISTLHAAGIVRYDAPTIEGNSYLLLGDPGVENAPGRNAPCIMVWDVSEFPNEPMRMVHFWWGCGKGSINPFLHQYVSCMVKWQPIFSGVDSTGTQKNMASIINDYLLTNRFGDENTFRSSLGINSIIDQRIAGLDFSTTRKQSYLLATRLMMEAGLITWPGIIVGLRAQLGNYDPEKDKSGVPKIPQDTVATLAMSCHAARSLFQVDPTEFLAGNKDENLSSFSQIPPRSLRIERKNINIIRERR